MRRILVTGGSGWIGQYTLNLLAQSGYEVHAVSHREIGLSLSNRECTWHKVNLLNREEVEGMMKTIQPTYLLHFAWEVTPGEYVASMRNFEWVRASLDLFRHFMHYGGKRVVVAGTCFEYDWKYGYLDENHTPCSYDTPYGTSKNALRLLLQSISDVTDLSSCWGRVFFLHGPREHPRRLVPSVVISLLKGEEALCTHGNQYRDFLHVHDVANAFVSLLESDVQGTVNIASGRPVQVKDIVIWIAKKLGKQDLVKFGALPFPEKEPLFIGANTQRLCTEIGWKPHFDLEEGLISTISWWKNHLGGGF